jgi:hypothetical protein
MFTMKQLGGQWAVVWIQSGRITFVRWCVDGFTAEKRKVNRANEVLEAARQKDARIEAGRRALAIAGEFKNPKNRQRFTRMTISAFNKLGKAMTQALESFNAVEFFDKKRVA